MTMTRTSEIFSFGSEGTRALVAISVLRDGGRNALSGLALLALVECTIAIDVLVC